MHSDIARHIKIKARDIFRELNDDKQLDKESLWWNEKI